MQGHAKLKSRKLKRLCGHSSETSVSWIYQQRPITCIPARVSNNFGGLARMRSLSSPLDNDLLSEEFVHVR